ncbi:MAG: RNA polymerase sigma factor, partial [Planctomycetes bacterium]|nr:RNA polymerase sigma factor [Planctomycetota bacterium]
MEPVRIESLLEDQAWLRGLARSLVRDPSLADDLVQEGWLRALTNPPARHVRSWWRAVLTRRAIDLRREAARRQAREERAPAPEAPSDDLLERVELQEAVAHAVRGLPEPYRGAILLRHFEGLPPRTIAKRLGIPVETVRTHLKRAHGMLRDRLDRERRDWKSAMLLLAW